MRPYVLTAAAAALAALALAGLAVLARTGAGPDAPTPARETAITAVATATLDPAPPAGLAPAAALGCLDGVTVDSPAANPGLVSDCEALLRARDALRGSAALDWSAGRPIASWNGVGLGRNPPRVTGLDLRGKGLTGTIPPELGGLTELTLLRLGGNRLTGRIPDLGGLSRLRVLDLHGNRLSGGIPARLGGAAGLAVLNLEGNRLTGVIPRSFGRLPRLYEIRLSGNDLTGCVPSALEEVRGDAAGLGLPWCTPPRPDVPSALETFLATRSGLDLMTPVPDAFAHRVFEDGEAIDWHGIFVFDVETGRTDGYAVAGLESEGGNYTPHRGGWIETAVRNDDDGHWRLLLDRETMRSWRWPGQSSLVLKATSEEHLLFFEERSGGKDESEAPGYLRATGREAGEPTGAFILANRLMEEIIRFSVGRDRLRSYATFAPDGRTIALDVADKVYLVPVATGHPILLSMHPPRHDEHPEFSLVGVGFGSRRLPPLGLAWRWYEGGQGIVVVARYRGPEPVLHEAQKEKLDGESEEDGPEEITELRFFGWDGEALPAPACPGAGTLSPDGRYGFRPRGGPYYQYPNYGPLTDPWPSVVVTDAKTCAPIFRVRSAYTYKRIWSAKWLPTSEGFVVGASGGFAIVRVGAAPSLTPLPRRDGWPGSPGPDPAPTEGDRYFGYGHRVYDAAEDRWHGPSGNEAVELDGPFWWGASHRERWFHSWIYWGEGWSEWLLLPPKIEHPPFAEEIAFRVARTGSCLRLREDPGGDGRVLHCLPDGERLLFAERDAEVERDWGPRPRSPHSSIALLERDYVRQVWVYVRTGDGAEGWVSERYLDHD